MEAIFVENLENIRQAATQKLGESLDGESLDITSMVYTRHFFLELHSRMNLAFLSHSYDRSFRADGFRLSETGSLVFFSTMMMSIWTRL